MFAGSTAPGDTPKAQHCSTLEGIVRQMINAINARDFDPQSQAWASTAESYTAEVAFTTSPKKFTLPEHLLELDKMTRDTPDLRLHILDLDTNLTSVKNPTQGHVFANLEWHTAEGFRRPCYYILDFVREQESWMCVRNRALPGIAAGSNKSEWAT